MRLVNTIQPDDFIATSAALVYPEDYPEETCDRHVLVDYCPGGGVCTEWCLKFAGVDPTLQFEKRGLVKMTQKEIEEILKAEPFKLIKDYYRNDYVYFINEDGTDGVFKGVKNDLEQSVDAPYMVCPLHTQQAWEAYEGTTGTAPNP